MFIDKRMSEDLDRHITGNYGEDEFLTTCSKCKRYTHCYDGDENGRPLCQKCYEKYELESVDEDDSDGI